MANKIQGPPTKQEIEAIFNRLRTQPANKVRHFHKNY